MKNILESYQMCYILIQLAADIKLDPCHYVQRYKALILNCSVCGLFYSYGGDKNSKPY